LNRFATAQTALEPETEGSAFDLEDPFIGLLGQKAGRDDLWLGKAVPRYTSYPPATAFEDGVTVQAYREALEALAPEEPISLYLHIPYCRALCLYCGCHTQATQNHEQVSSYLGSVHRELEGIALTAPRSRRVSHVHFGGGSPNMMSEKDLGLMMGSLVRRFALDDATEIAMELDPRLITRAQAQALGMLGVTRVSLGVQDFDPDVQKAIGRIQPFDQVERACSLLREAGIRKINLDLMYGLPLQSPPSVAQTAMQALALRPDRIALFSYAHVPQAKKHQRVLEQYILPGPYAALAMEGAARAVLREAGMVEIGMDHFARPTDSLVKALEAGTLHRNFQGYTDDQASTMLGVGASSIGRMGQGYFQNERNVAAYQERVRAEGFSVTRGLRLKGEDKLRGAIIESLLCTMKVNLESLCRARNYSLSILVGALDRLKPFEEAGLVKREGYTITLTTPHRMAVRVVASLFDTTTLAKDAPVSRAM
jgi:oxygen-independent coproporphyrinogen-3 oxidase